MACTSFADEHDPDTDFVDLSIILEQRHTLVEEFFNNKYDYTVGSTPDLLQPHETSIALLTQSVSSGDNPSLKNR
jgi:hypothetical protein